MGGISSHGVVRHTVPWAHKDFKNSCREGLHAYCLVLCVSLCSARHNSEGQSKASGGAL